MRTTDTPGFKPFTLYHNVLKLFQEESDTRLSVQEALSMMAPSYRKADPTILALIESLILNYVQQVTCPPCFPFNAQLLLWD